MKSDPLIVPEEPQPTAEELLAVEAGYIADAIYGAEGRCNDLHGASGEYGCYQYLPSTWRAYSILVAGEVLVQTRENERFVTESMILMWLKEGKNARWVFLEWNQGEGDGWGPGTIDCYEGWNDAGVYYNSCDYAARATAFYEEARLLSQPSL